jgi:hypothetical protein
MDSCLIQECTSLRYNQQHLRTYDGTSEISETGLPIAYLFLLTVDVLGHMLQDPTHWVLAMLLPNGAQSTSQMFTDETAFYLAGSKENMERTMAMLHKFGAASGAKLKYGCCLWKRTGHGERLRVQMAENFLLQAEF